MIFELDFSVLKGMSLLSAKRDIRYYLNGVLIELTNNGAYFVATDGHKMGILHNPHITALNDQKYIIPNSLIESATKAKISGLVELELTTSTATIKQAQMQFSAPLVEGVFPDWRRVLPSEVKNIPCQFNPDLLMEFKKAAIELTGAKKAFIEIGFNGETGGASIVKIDNEYFLGLIMPTKAAFDCDKFKKPFWIDYPSINKEKAA